MSYLIDATTDYITFPNIDNLNDGNPVSVAAWCKHSSMNTTCRSIFSVNNSSDTDYVVRFYAYDFQPDTPDNTYFGWTQYGAGADLEVSEYFEPTADHTGTWEHYLVTASGSTFGNASNQAVYWNGIWDGVFATTQNATGGFETASGKWCIGGADHTANRNMYGNVAEVAVWRVRLSDGEAAALAAGVSPLSIRPSQLIFYAPLVRDVIDVVSGQTGTTNGVTVADHPPVVRPSNNILQLSSGPRVHAVSTDDIVQATEDPWVIDGARFGAR